jgi:hypothetical protein
MSNINPKESGINLKCAPILVLEMLSYFFWYFGKKLSLTPMMPSLLGIIFMSQPKHLWKFTIVKDELVRLWR